MVVVSAGTMSHFSDYDKSGVNSQFPRILLPDSFLLQLGRPIRNQGQRRVQLTLAHAADDEVLPIRKYIEESLEIVWAQVSLHHIGGGADLEGISPRFYVCRLDHPIGSHIEQRQAIMSPPRRGASR